VPPRDTAHLIAADKRHVWHPFTQMQEWCAPEHEPLVLVEGEGAILLDSRGREYIDGNSSIWTNLHGHNHPKINAAIRAQLDRVAHTSFLGFTNPPAIALAEELVECGSGLSAATGAHAGQGAATFPTLTRVFYSDDGSTAIEVAIKMAIRFWQLTGRPERQRFVAFSGAYHGDTMGASSLGGISIFHENFSPWQFPVEHAGSLDGLEKFDANEIAAVVIEPLIQGAAGMKLWPRGMLAGLRAWCDAHDVLLIADEVMTGFGRTGTMFACEQEGVVPDFLALAKGLTGGYMPLAATLTTERVFAAFLGRFEEQKTFYYGHSYTGNQLACAAALANLRIFRDENVLANLQPKIRALSDLLGPVAALPHVGEVRQCGFVAGIELMRDKREPFDWREQTGARVCLAARKHGLLTRPIRDAIVLMPPFCISESQLRQAARAVEQAIGEVCG
jgi:adenosylmethionine---8-amino-7-oxononanoate aminotransferase